MTKTDTFHTQDAGALWATRDLSSFIGCSERHIARLREEGLPFVRVGGLIRFIPARVTAWLECRDERARQLADIGANNGEDADEISASDAFKEFPPSP
jgi:phage terminase Nu1 subunit (DNA packaging protein)